MMKYRTIEDLNPYLEDVYGSFYVAIPNKYMDYLLKIKCTNGVVTGAFTEHMAQLGFRFKNAKIEDEELIACFEVP